MNIKRRGGNLSSVSSTSRVHFPPESGKSEEAKAATREPVARRFNSSPFHLIHYRGNMSARNLLRAQGVRDFPPTTVPRSGADKGRPTGGRASIYETLGDEFFIPFAASRLFHTLGIAGVWRRPGSRVREMENSFKSSSYEHFRHHSLSGF